jgi:5,6-dimethylbenzimidazole synthase
LSSTGIAILFHKCFAKRKIISQTYRLTPYPRSREFYLMETTSLCSSTVSTNTTDEAATPPIFSDIFASDFASLLRWRRDVRHFSARDVPAGLVTDCLALATLAPSVGYAQPWRFVLNEAPARRQDMISNFETANSQALGGYNGERKAAYARLKLAGLAQAPVHLAVLCDESTADGHGLGRATMPEMLRYSVVCAVHTFWLAARVRGLGVGWVSILDPVQALATLSAPAGHSLVAYLCVGWPETDRIVPELEREGWQEKRDPASHVWTLL